MSNTTKTILVIISVLVIVCACGSAAFLATGAWTVSKIVRWTNTSTSEDPQLVSGIADEIADFDLPAGFGSPDGVHFADFSAVSYRSQSGDTHIFLVQFPRGTRLDADEMLNTIKHSSAVLETPWYGIQMATVEQKPVTVHGQESTLIIQEGITSDGEAFRTGIVTFQAEGSGPALLMVAGPVEEWDAEMLDSLIASVK